MNLRRACASALVTVAVLAGAAPASAAPGDWTLGGVPCELIEVPAAAPLGTGECPGVRPGAVVESDNGQCTFNFLFQGSDGARYIGTAGHCILGDDPLGGDAGEQSWAAGSGPEARDGAGNRIGEFAYAILQDPKDFALIRLDPGVAANAQMCHFGGPTGVNTDRGATRSCSITSARVSAWERCCRRAARSRSACPIRTTCTRRAPSCRVTPVAASSRRTAARWA